MIYSAESIKQLLQREHLAEFASANADDMALSTPTGTSPWMD